MSNSGYQLLTNWVSKRANHTHAAVEKWWTHVDSHGLACRKSARKTATLFTSQWHHLVCHKKAQIPAVKEPVGQHACKMANVPMAPAPQSCYDWGASDWHGMSEFRRPHIPVPAIIIALQMGNTVSFQTCSMLSSSSITRSHSTQRSQLREIFIRIKQATKRDMPIKPGAYCLATYQRYSIQTKIKQKKKSKRGEVQHKIDK